MFTGMVIWPCAQTCGLGTRNMTRDHPTPVAQTPAFLIGTLDVSDIMNGGVDQL